MTCPHPIKIIYISLLATLPSSTNKSLPLYVSFRREFIFSAQSLGERWVERASGSRKNVGDIFFHSPDTNSNWLHLLNNSSRASAKMLWIRFMSVQQQRRLPRSHTQNSAKDTVEHTWAKWSHEWEDNEPKIREKSSLAAESWIVGLSTALWPSFSVHVRERINQLSGRSLLCARLKVRKENGSRSYQFARVNFSGILVCITNRHAYK